MNNFKEKLTSDFSYTFSFLFLILFYHIAIYILPNFSSLLKQNVLINQSAVASCMKF